VNAKRGLIAAVALTVALAAPAGADARCRTAGAKVLDHDATGVVFAKGAKVYACLQRLGVRRPLPTPGPYEGVRGHVTQGGDEGAAPRIAGGFVAYVVTGRDPLAYPSPGQPVAWVRLYDLRGGRVVRSAAAATDLFPGGDESNVPQLVVKRSGSFAWIVRSVRDARYQQHPPETAVRVIELHRQAATVDYVAEQQPTLADEIDLTSLSLTPDRGSITWRHLDGRRLSAALR
jgi:hypothetical protein